MIYDIIIHHLREQEDPLQTGPAIITATANYFNDIWMPHTIAPGIIQTFIESCDDIFTELYTKFGKQNAKHIWQEIRRILIAWYKEIGERIPRNPKIKIEQETDMIVD